MEMQAHDNTRENVEIFIFFIIIATKFTIVMLTQNWPYIVYLSDKEYPMELVREGRLRDLWLYNLENSVLLDNIWQLSVYTKYSKQKWLSTFIYFFLIGWETNRSQLLNIWDPTLCKTLPASD